MRRKMFVVGICLMILVLGGCGAQATTASPTQQPVPATVVVGNPVPTEPPVSEIVIDTDPTKTIPTSPTEQDDIRGVIIDADAIPLDSVQIHISNVEDLWTPTEDDVLQLEAGLATYLQQAAEPEHERIWGELPSYHRQYVGIIQDGQRKIYTNFFCEGNNSDSTLLIVLDGGDCHFQVIYNAEENRFSYLYVHGEA